MTGWKPSAQLGLVMTFPSLIFFVAFAAHIGPNFAKMFSDFGSQMPLPTRIAVHPMTSVGVIGFLISGIVGGALRPNERFIILPLVAGAGFALGIFAMIAVYLPIFSIAGAIQ